MNCMKKYLLAFALLPGIISPGNAQEHKLVQNFT